MLSLGKKRPKIGDRIYTIGHPAGTYYTINEGIVSNYTKRSYKRNKLNLMLVSAPTFSGGSGGAVINTKTEIVGIVVAIEYYQEKKQTIYLTNMVYTIRLDTICDFLESLLSKGVK